MMICGDVNYEMYDRLKACKSWEDLEKTNYTKYLDETFSEYMKSFYERISSLKNEIFKSEEFLGNKLIKNTKVNSAKLIELKKCRTWLDLEKTGYAQHIDKTFRAYMRRLYHSLIDMTKANFNGTEKTIWMLEQELLLKDLVTLAREIKSDVSAKDTILMQIDKN